MSKENKAHIDEKEHHSHIPHHHANSTYRAAILNAIDSQKDYRDRSNIESIRRHTQDLLEGHAWNDSLFLVTLQSIVRQGEIQVFPNSVAGLSPEFKRSRADSFMRKLDECLEDADGAPLPELHAPRSPKPPPVRKPEHDKFRIVKKKVYDHTMCVGQDEEKRASSPPPTLLSRVTNGVPPSSAANSHDSIFFAFLHRVENPMDTH